jgi:prepilin signal peptidase PulO-like enzyme (type II secretory pathway)
MTAFADGAWLFAWAALLSALAVRAQRAAGCGASFATTLLVAMAPAIVASAFREPRESLASGAVAVALAVGAVSDATTGYVFDCITAPTAAAAIGLAAFATDGASPAAGVLLFVAPLAIAAANSWIGWGDVKILFSVALAFGISQSLLILFVAALSGLLSLRVRAGGDPPRRIPFVPHLTIGAIVTIAFGKPLLRTLVGD